MRYSDQKMYEKYIRDNANGTPSSTINQKSFSPASLINQLRSIMYSKPNVLVKTLVQIYKMPGGAKILNAIKSALRLKR